MNEWFVCWVSVKICHLLIDLYIIYLQKAGWFIIWDVLFCPSSWGKCTRLLWCVCSLRETGVQTLILWFSTALCSPSLPVHGTGSDSTRLAIQLFTTGKLNVRISAWQSLICVWKSGGIHQCVGLHHLHMGERWWSGFQWRSHTGSISLS